MIPNGYLQHNLNQELIVNDSKRIHSYAGEIELLDTEDKESDAFYLKQMLWAYIVFSKDEIEGKKVEIGAANAITILNAANVSFSGLDLSSIKISGANLSGAILDHTNLENANLQSVNLQGSWLRDANLKKTSMRKVFFGEKPSINFKNKINVISYSPDDESLAITCDNENKIYFYYPQTRNFKFYITTGHNSIKALSFSSNNLLASVENNEIHIINILEKKLINSLIDDNNIINTIKINAHDDYLLFGGTDKSLKLWNSKNNTVLKGYNCESAIQSIDINKDNVIAIGCENGNVLLLKIIISEQNNFTVNLLHCFKKHIMAINMIIFGDNNYLASAGDDKTVQLWNLNFPNYHVHTFTVPTSEVTCIAFGLKNLLAAGSKDRRIQVYDINTKVLVYKLEGHTEWITSITFINHNILMSGSADRTVRTWILNQNTILRALPGHFGGIRSSAFNSSYTLASGSADYGVKLWDMKEKKLLLNLDKRSLEYPYYHSEHVTSVAFSSDGRYLASASLDKTVQIWDIFENKITDILNKHTEQINCTIFKNHGISSAALASGSDDKFIYLWNLSNNKFIHSNSLEHKSAVKSIAINSIDSLLAAGCGNKESVNEEKNQDIKNYNIYLWHLNDTLRKPDILKGHSDSVTSVSFSSDNLLASGSLDMTVLIWDLSTLSLLRKLVGHSKAIRSLAVSPTNILASGSWDKTVRLWNINNGNCIAIVPNYAGFVHCVAWQKCGNLNANFLVVVGSNNAIRYWQITQKENNIKIILQWSNAEATLVATHANLTECRDLESDDRELLIQNGAINNNFLDVKNDIQSTSISNSEENINQSKNLSALGLFVNNSSQEANLTQKGINIIANHNSVSTSIVTENRHEQSGASKKFI